MYGSHKIEQSQAGNPNLVTDESGNYFYSGLDLGIQYFLTSSFAINFNLAVTLSGR